MIGDLAKRILKSPIGRGAVHGATVGAVSGGINADLKHPRKALRAVGRAALVGAAAGGTGGHVLHKIGTASSAFWRGFEGTGL